MALWYAVGELSRDGLFHVEALAEDEWLGGRHGYRGCSPARGVNSSIARSSGTDGRESEASTIGAGMLRPRRQLEVDRHAARFDRQPAVAAPTGAPGYALRRAAADVPEIHHLTDADANDEAGGCGRSNPAGCVRRAGRERRPEAGERDDAGRAFGRFEAAEDLRVLHRQTVGREELVRLAAASSRSSSSHSENRLKRVRHARTHAEMWMRRARIVERAVGPDRGDGRVVEMAVEPEAVKD